MTPCETCGGFGTITDIDASARVCPFSEAICPDCDGAGEVEDADALEEAA